MITEGSIVKIKINNKWTDGKVVEVKDNGKVIVCYEILMEMDKADLCDVIE